MKCSVDNKKLEICDVCGIKRIDGVFYFSNNNQPATDNKVYSRVCTYIQNNPDKKAKCLNTCGKYNEDLAFKNLEPNLDYDMSKLGIVWK